MGFEEARGWERKARGHLKGMEGLMGHSKRRERERERERERAYERVRDEPLELVC